jgi:hypothetical protein
MTAFSISTPIENRSAWVIGGWPKSVAVVSGTVRQSCGETIATSLILSEGPPSVSPNGYDDLPVLLCSRGRRFGAGSPAVAAEDLDLGVLPQPGSWRERDGSVSNLNAFQVKTWIE